MRRRQKFSSLNFSLFVILRFRRDVALNLSLLPCILLSLSLFACEKSSPVERRNTTPQQAQKRDASAPAPKQQTLPQLKKTAPTCLAPFSPTPAPAVKNARSCPDDPEGRPVMPSGIVSFTTSSGVENIEVELAVTTAHQRHGLMYRSDLTEGQGMLFSFSNSSLRSFWMKNTCLALDMIFIDHSGAIVGILEQVPPQNTAPRSVPCLAQHVLEVPAGYVRKVGLKPGSRLDLSSAQLTHE